MCQIVRGNGRLDAASRERFAFKVNQRTLRIGNQRRKTFEIFPIGKIPFLGEALGEPFAIAKWENAFDPAKCEAYLKEQAAGHIDPSGSAARTGLSGGDVILQVSRHKVESAAEASRELQKVPSGGTALLLIWRKNQEIFLTLKKD